MSAAEALSQLHAQEVLSGSVADSATVPGTSAGSTETTETSVDSVASVTDKSVNSVPSSASSSSSGSSVTVNSTKSSKKPVFSEEDFPVLGSGAPAPRPAARTWAATAAPSVVPARAGTITDAFSLSAEVQNKISKSDFAAIILRIKKTTGTSIECSTSKLNGVKHFLVKGPPEAVYAARRELIRALSVPVHVEFDIPASARGTVIGPGGRTLKPIVERSQTKINVGKLGSPTEDADEAVVTITVDGDAEGVAMAKQEILAIVDEKLRDLTVKLPDIPAHYYPFLAPRVDELAEGKEVQVTLDAEAYLSDSQPAPILISGLRSDVQWLKQQITELLSVYATSFGTKTVTMPRNRHKLLLLDENAEPAPAAARTEFFRSSGCILRVPPTEAPADAVVEVFGPAAKLANAATLAASNARAFVFETLDISLAHGKNFPHARHLARFLSSANCPFVPTSREEHKVFVAVPSIESLYSDAAKSVVIEMAGRDAEAVKTVRKQLVAFVNSLPPAHVLAVDDVDSFFFAEAAKRVANLENNVVAIVPSEAEAAAGCNEIVFVYRPVEADGDAADFGPAAEDVAAALAEANSVFDDLRHQQNDLVAETLPLPEKEHKYVTGPNNTTLKAILRSVGGRVTVTFGSDSVTIRGLRPHVEAAVKEISRAAKEGAEYAAQGEYKVEFAYPAAALNRLIGKQGAHLRELSSEYGVTIDIGDDGKVVVRGPKKNTETARDHIVSQGRIWADEQTATVDVPRRFHRALIGANGSLVRRLEDKYNVQIRFPRSAGDGNAVRIRGPSRGVAQARDELVALLQFEQEHSFRVTVSVPRSALAYVIGRGGERITRIGASTGTEIHVQSNRESSESNSESAETETPEADDKADVEIIGTRSGVADAQKQIEALVAQHQSRTSREISIDPKYLGTLIGKDGTALWELVTETIGPVDKREVGSLVQIPHQGSKRDTITLEGDKAVVDKLAAAIEAFKLSQASRKTERMAVPRSKHRFLVGAGGTTRRELEDTFHVRIDIPPVSSSSEEISVEGQPEDIAAAMARIKELTADRWQSSVAVPRKLAADLWDGGSLGRFVRGEFGAGIEFGPQRPPKKPKAVSVPSEANGADDEDTKWTIVADTAAESAESSETTEDSSETEATIPFGLVGSAEACTEAKSHIEKELASIQQWNATGFLWVKETRRFGHVIGPQGRTVARIRSKSGCRITVPRSGDASHVITVRGSTQGLEIARGMLQQLLNGKQE